MIEKLDEVEFETRTIGPLVLTTPVLRVLGFNEIVDHHCPIAEQGDIDHGTIAELVVQCRLSDPRALYDTEDWADMYAIPELYAEIEGIPEFKTSQKPKISEDNGPFLGGLFPWKSLRKQSSSTTIASGECWMPFTTSAQSSGANWSPTLLGSMA